MTLLKNWGWLIALHLFVLLLTPVYGQNVSNSSMPCEYKPGANTKNSCKDDNYTCSENKQCVKKTCKYDLNDIKSKDLPLCPDDQYCPFDQVQCLPKGAIGATCSLTRSDSPCLGDSTIMCFLQVCSSRNATLGSVCQIDPSYKSPTDNCVPNTWCSNNICVETFALGESCNYAQQCQSTHCLEGQCQVGEEQELYHSLPVWVYIVIGVVCAVAILSCGLFIYFRRRRRVKNYKQMLNLSMTTLNQYDNNRDSNPSYASPAPENAIRQ
ncbi:hypothetical protein K7432_012274 [Basidiobolus ranarum]|uniref:Uncharacterized protein n=1 Tax=Basidiobolus ranarum TaxID=34480 RepID=A0ABR2VSI1_9FUNG